MTQKGFGLIAIIIGIVILLAVGTGVGYLVNKKPAEPQVSPATPAEKDETADWKTYRNEEYGYELKYPGDWSYEKKSVSIGESNQFADFNGKHVLSINNPVREIGYEVFDLVERSKIKISNTDEYFDKTIHKSSGEEGGLILVRWILRNFGWSSEIALGYAKDNDPNIEILNQILSTFKFIEFVPEIPKIPVVEETADWKTYINAKYRFTLKYPKRIERFSRYDSLEGSVEASEWINIGRADSGIAFGPPKSKSVGYIWGVVVFDKSNLEDVIKYIGLKFDDRIEKRENIIVNDKPALLVTVTTNQSKDWFSKTVFIERDGTIFSMSNGIGAVDVPEFENFYKSFTFF